MDPSPNFLIPLSGSMTFGKLIQSIRESEQESIEQFAGRLWITPQNLMSIEEGYETVTTVKAKAWARVLGYSETQFAALAMLGRMGGDS